MKITEEQKHNAEWYGVHVVSPVEVQWAALGCSAEFLSQIT